MKPDADPEYVWLPTEELTFELAWEPLAPSQLRRRCRYTEHGERCPKPSVARLKHASTGPEDSRWWYYCQQHLFGRRIRYGRMWTRLHVNSPSVQQRLRRAQ